VQRSTKWVAVIVAIVLVAGSIFAGVVSLRDTSSKSTTPTTKTSPKVLDTSSQKIAAEYQGVKLTEGQLNAYININAFFDTQLAAIFASTDPAVVPQQKQAREEFAKIYLTKQHIAGLKKVTPEIKKKIDQQVKELETQVIQYAKTLNPKAKINTLQDAIVGKGFTRSQLVMVAERDAKVDLYLSDQTQNMKYDRVRLRHILISYSQPGAEVQPGQPKRTVAEASARALQVKQKLDAGGDFAKLAKEYTDDPGSKDTGGFYDADVSGFVPEFSNAAKTLPIGKISDPIKTEYGYHIMKVEERKQDLIKNAPKDQHDQLVNTKKQDVFNSIQKNLKIKLYI
jgi:foldase protein PrsA